MTCYQIVAHYDPEAGVWWAESQDIRGLVAEAGTLDNLLQDLRQTVSDLLQLNHDIDPWVDVTMTMTIPMLRCSERTANRPPR